MFPSLIYVIAISNGAKPSCALWGITDKIINKEVHPNYVLTETQKETLDKLKEGKLSPKQRSDFYYRMSKILKQEIEGLEDISLLIDELPESYLEKIDLREAAIRAMKLTEKLIKKTRPALTYSTPNDKNDKFVAVRNYWVDFGSLIQGLEQYPYKIKVTFKPTKEDIEYFRKVLEYLMHSSDRIYNFSFDNKAVFKIDDLNKVLSELPEKRLELPKSADTPPRYTEIIKGVWPKLLTSEYNLPESEVPQITKMFEGLLAEIEERYPNVAKKS